MLTILNDAGLHALAELIHRGFTHRGVDVLAIHGVNAKRENNRLGFTGPRGHRGDMEGRRFIGLAHVTSPFGMEMEAALNTGFF